VLLQAASKQTLTTAKFQGLHETTFGAQFTTCCPESAHVVLCFEKERRHQLDSSAHDDAAPSLLGA
jgi:hypothetical protein